MKNNAAWYLFVGITLLLLRYSVNNRINAMNRNTECVSVYKEIESDNNTNNNAPSCYAEGVEMIKTFECYSSNICLEPDYNPNDNWKVAINKGRLMWGYSTHYNVLDGRTKENGRGIALYLEHCKRLKMSPDEVYRLAIQNVKSKNKVALAAYSKAEASSEMREYLDFCNERQKKEFNFADNDMRKWLVNDRLYHFGPNVKFPKKIKSGIINKTLSLQDFLEWGNSKYKYDFTHRLTQAYKKTFKNGV